MRPPVAVSFTGTPRGTRSPRLRRNRPTERCLCAERTRNGRGGAAAGTAGGAARHRGCTCRLGGSSRGRAGGHLRRAGPGAARPVAETSLEERLAPVTTDGAAPRCGQDWPGRSTPIRLDRWCACASATRPRLVSPSSELVLQNTHSPRAARALGRAKGDHGVLWSLRASRRATIPSRMRLFAVPSGTPVICATSRCV